MKNKDNAIFKFERRKLVLERIAIIVERISTIPFYGSVTTPTIQNEDLIEYQRLRGYAKESGMIDDIKKCDEIISNATFNLIKTPLYLST